ncbi:MAG: ABC transporter ATP-binding protein [Archangium sp.]|nr:ABC transporter ATP-binding protein [Archangium sp.]
MASVTLSSVHKAYGDTKVVKGISLELKSGGFLALLGPSGCGKTTTLRMIAGLENVDAGTIHIDSQLVDGPNVRIPPEKRELGMVFQSYAVWPHRSVKENVGYPLSLRGVSKSDIDRRVKEALDWVRLAAFADRMPSQLSGGQLQRVAIARALVAQPKVLLLDEPLSNLDMALREELRGEIAALRARLGTTMIFVTHDQHEALALADHVAVMNKGVIEQLDSPRTIYEAPATPYVAGFVGGSNLLEGTAADGTFTSHGISFVLPDSLKTVTGPGTLAVRAEAMALGQPDGTPLPLLARLFLGHSMEFRLALGDQILRVINSADEAAGTGTLTARITAAHFFPASRT